MEKETERGREQRSRKQINLISLPESFSFTLKKEKVEIEES